MTDQIGSMATINEAELLELRSIGKSFPGVRVLNGVDFTLRAGEVHALCGENGAGKSTLVKIIAGSQRPDSGKMFFRGSEVDFSGPLDAKNKGILLIHQELSLVPGLSVAENIYLGSMPRHGFGHVDRKALMENTNRLLDDLRCDFRASDPVGELSIARQQLVEIARAQAFSSSIVIFDEPTASLSDRETEALFEVIAKLRSAGTAIIYISHRLDEVFALSDRVTVLRDGRLGGSYRTADTNRDEVTRAMIGRSVEKYFPKVDATPGSEVLRVEGLEVGGYVRDASFSVHQREIVGLYGLVGAGRSEMMEAIFGMRKLSAGQIFWHRGPVTIDSCRTAMELGIGLVPEDRKRQGLVLGMTAAENLSLTVLNKIQSFSFIRKDEEMSLFERYRKRLSIKVSSPQQQALTLSGGNQQKIVIAKWLATDARLLILDEPTRGIDVGAKAEVHALIAELAQSGLAVVVISSDMEEVIGISHRVLTMYEGRISGEFAGDDVTEQNLIAAITGHVWSDRPNVIEPTSEISHHANAK
ncbi:sugar ABC transporter ATP-binding protein [Paraburkholderia sp. J12]|uniref:sugar ABC transporter ATP-binding protein n=1 Tax=Paraburkholderia sp. J12 TaxID=2805432 RepID=UPI002ABD2C91|nr:sugar ABC transporter ATP-binding protein [Paraburkholderia sp. J12]